MSIDKCACPTFNPICVYSFTFLHLSLCHTCFNLSVYSSGLSCHTLTHSQRIINLYSLCYSVNFISFNLFLLFWPFSLIHNSSTREEHKMLVTLSLTIMDEVTKQSNTNFPREGVITISSNV